MPEACFLCLDSTEFMRNGDQFPNRLMSEQEVANLLVNAKFQRNAENTVGFLTTGGNACTVFETLTFDVDRIMASLTNIPINGKVCHFANGLLIASLALTHRSNPRSTKRIVAFVGSPVMESAEELAKLAKKLRKDDVAVDVVCFGVEANIPLLESFVEQVSKQDNSHFLAVRGSANLTDAVMSSPILLGEDAGMGGGGAEGGATAADFGFGIDPNVDPELAMALRMSMEDEMQRQAAMAAVASGAGTSGGEPAPSQPAAPPAELNEEDFANMSEEEMLRRAIAMSLEASAPPPTASPPAQDPSSTNSNNNNASNGGDEEAKK